jgi:hypothetical protein
MSASQVSAVLVHALHDEHFRRRLLATPNEALTHFDLSPDELDALSSIRASTLEEYAVAMVNWLSGARFGLRH